MSCIIAFPWLFSQLRNMKLIMLIIPLLFIVAGYLIYRSKYKIDKKMYDNILAELHERGELHLDKEFDV